MSYPYRVLYSRRKTLALEISRDLEVIVRAPRYLSSRAVADFVAQHESWIDRAMERERHRRETALVPSYTDLTEAQVRDLFRNARETLPERVAFYSRQMGVSPTRITVTGARTRFGSCSGKNALCFSCYLMLYPPEAIDYVVVHELAHILHHNHSARFWAVVETYLPDYKERRKLLR